MKVDDDDDDDELLEFLEALDVVDEQEVDDEFGDFDEDPHAVVIDDSTWTLKQRLHYAECQQHWSSSREPVRVGRFEGVRFLGEGGFGLVIEARDPRLDRRVALKLCKVVSLKHRVRLMREAQLLARLSEHSNIITIHEIDHYRSDRVPPDAHHESPIIVMELAEGGTGRKLMSKRPDWVDCVDFYRGAGRGLAAAHAEGIVHGDFKPSNVIAGRDGTRVADFGFAHTVGGAARHRGGTPGYMAPEQLIGAGSSALTDQWAFCVALWETIVGAHLFKGAETVAAMRERIEAGALDEGSMPPRLRRTLQQGLAFVPERRWPSMEALVDELDAIVASARASALPTEGVGGRPRLPGGYLVYTILGGLLGAMLVALCIDRPRAQSVALYVDSPKEEQLVEDVALERDVDETEELVDGSSERNVTQEAATGAAEDVNNAERNVDEAEDLVDEPSKDVAQEAATGEANEIEGHLDEADDQPCAPNNTFHVPSKELQSVCTMIRDGRHDEAAKQWQDVRTERTPERSDEQIMYVATETKILIDTCEDYRSSIEDETLVKSAETVLEAMTEMYRLDRDELNSSQ